LWQRSNYCCSSVAFAKAEWSVDRITNWAGRIGENTRALITKVLETKEHPEQGFKVSLGILSLARKYSDIRLDKACSQALLYHNYSMKSIKNMLEHKLEDQQDLFLNQEINTAISAHENIRGYKYYN
jgi:hypothetical protein